MTIAKLFGRPSIPAFVQGMAALLAFSKGHHHAMHMHECELGRDDAYLEIFGSNKQLASSLTTAEGKTRMVSQKLT